ncbi:TPA: hypothetical protein N0F65_012056 [Lagenidium giganteum]|uniref:DUF7869 domain-containing protein n=1 Tax=Lagenidium giganteum TaxID=4803 RepID=A0AAV2YUJ0_9STRA|nr:TPA: hypothetical protein N0F65_012056 [Lagenidium giganteum]
MGRLEHLEYKFFVQGHTRNACDRGFGHIRKHIAHIDCWTMEQLVEAVYAAAASADTVHVTRDSDVFRDYKPAIMELYKHVEVLSKFQIFVKDANTPGVVECKISPDGDSVSQDLRRQIDGILTTKEKSIRIAEKVIQMHTTVRPHVPTEFRDDPMYAAPSEGQMEASKTTKNVILCLP